MNLQFYTNRGGEKRLVADLGEHGHGKRLSETLINPQKKKQKENLISKKLLQIQKPT